VPEPLALAHPGDPCPESVTQWRMQAPLLSVAVVGGQGSGQGGMLWSPFYPPQHCGFAEVGGAMQRPSGQ
jgi:hypothetical protein